MFIGSLPQKTYKFNPLILLGSIYSTLFGLINLPISGS